jgi:flagellar biosynthesis/type III secretory pathway protein FliH
MTIPRARIIKSDDAASARIRTAPSPAATLARARRIPAEIVDARAEAARIVADAQAAAAAVAQSAALAAAEEARQAETARLAAAFLVLRDESARRAERDTARLVELAAVLAERLIGEALRLDPSRIAQLAAVALEEARGAERVRIDACPEDTEALESALAPLGGKHAIEVNADASLARGSLVVHTDVGRLDARLTPQLTRLAAALREALS